jgi:F-type H+-transporting ATPase subunit b
VTDAARDAGRGVVVRSAFPLDDRTRSEVAEVVSQMLEAADVPLEFVTQPELVAGIDLDAGSYRVAWSLDEHLASLEQDMAEVLADEAP